MTVIYLLARKLRKRSNLLKVLMIPTAAKITKMFTR